MKSITVGDMTNYDSVRLVHFRSINVNKNLGHNEKIFWILWLRQVRLTYMKWPLIDNWIWCGSAKDRLKAKSVFSRPNRQ